MGKKKYSREVVISKLLAKGLKPKPSLDKLVSFEVPPRVQLGIKSLGMLDFLKISVTRPVRKPYDPNKKRERPRRQFQVKTIGQCLVCKKEVDNTDGFWRICFDNKIVKVHKGRCVRRHNLLIFSGLSLSEIENQLGGRR